MSRFLSLETQPKHCWKLDSRSDLLWVSLDFRSRPKFWFKPSKTKGKEKKKRWAFRKVWSDVHFHSNQTHTLIFVFKEAVGIIHLKAKVLEHTSRRQFPSLIVLWELKLNPMEQNMPCIGDQPEGKNKKIEPSRLNRSPYVGAGSSSPSLRACPWKILLSILDSGKSLLTVIVVIG